MLTKRKRGKIWYVRGTVLGRRFNERSTGTASQAQAEKTRIRWESELADSRPHSIGFAEALNRYLGSGGEDRFLEPLLLHFKTTPINEIDNAAIDNAATILYPGAVAATRNRQVHTPMLAILHRAGHELRGSRPRQKKPPPRKAPDAEWFIAVLPYCPANLAALILFLSSTGARISEALAADMDLPAFEATMQTKTGPRLVRLPIGLVAIIANLEKPDGYPFGYRYRNPVYYDLKKACAAAGVKYFTTHELGRHYLARAILKKRYTLKHVQEACGWKSGRLVMETYGHLERGDYEGIRDEILEDFGQAVGTHEASH